MLRARYQRLNDREKLLLWLGSPAALLLIAYLLLWRPLTLEREQLREQVEARQALVGWMQTAALEAKRLQQNRPAASAGAVPLQQVISTRAAAQGIKLERMQNRDDTQAQLWLDNADFNQLLPFLDHLSRDGVRVEKASLRTAKTPGRVDAQFTFSRGG